MANNRPYACSACKGPTPREHLLVKKVIFQELGVKPKMARSRTAAWLCPSCLQKDPHWNLGAYVAPGMVEADEFDAALQQPNRN